MNSMKRMSRGFTILEILIVVSITIMVSALAISYRSSSQQQVGLYVEVQKLAELILRAKSLAVSTYNDPAALSDPSTMICGYGVSIDYTPNHNGYTLFSYRVPLGRQCENITTIENDAAANTSIVTFSRYDVAPGVVILKDGFPDSIYKIFFVPPTPVTLIGVNPDEKTVERNRSAPGKIYLTTKDVSINATISVSSFGQVDF